MDWMHDQADRPQLPDLVGRAEAAAAAGLSGQRITQLEQAGRMPQPVARVAATPLWVRADIERWAEERTPQPGRPSAQMTAKVVVPGRYSFNAVVVAGARRVVVPAPVRGAVQRIEWRVTIRVLSPPAVDDAPLGLLLGTASVHVELDGSDGPATIVGQVRSGARPQADGGLLLEVKSPLPPQPTGMVVKDSRFRPSGLSPAERVVLDGSRLSVTLTDLRHAIAYHGDLVEFSETPPSGRQVRVAVAAGARIPVQVDDVVAVDVMYLDDAAAIADGMVTAVEDDTTAGRQLVTVFSAGPSRPRFSPPPKPVPVEV